MSLLSPKPEKLPRGWFDRLSLILFTGIAAVVLFTLPDYGMSWDEPFRWKGGQEKLLYYQAILNGEPAANLGSKPDRYPGLFDLCVATFNEITPVGLLLSGHILSAAFGFLAFVLVWKIGRLIGGPSAAFWALLLAVLTPRFYGHLFFNPKDIPFASTYLLATYGLLRVLPSLPRPSWKQTLGLGVLVGLCMATRFAGIIHIGFAGIAALTAFLYDVKTRNRNARERIHIFSSLTVKGIVLFLTALLTVLPFWPYAQWNPLEAFFGAAQATAHFDWNAPVLYWGQQTPATELPWHYLPVWILITTPLTILVLLVIGTGLCVSRLLQWRKGNLASARIVLLVFITFFPPIFAMIKGSTVYDGLRHFLFVLPLLAILASLAFQNLQTLLEKRSRIAGVLLFVLLLASLIPVCIKMVRLHPYQYIFFNSTVGGSSGANGEFEIDYWALSYRESIEGLETKLLSDSRWTPDNPPKIYISYLPIAGQLFAPKEWILVKDHEKADFILVTTRIPEENWPNGKIVLSTEREGVPLSVVIRRQ